jgi:hypothetical protein
MKNTVLQQFQVSSRRERRNAAGFAVALLDKIKCAEWNSLNRIPENFQCCDSYLAAEESFDVLCDVLDMLPDAYT